MQRLPCRPRALRHWDREARLFCPLQKEEAIIRTWPRDDCAQFDPQWELAYLLSRCSFVYLQQPKLFLRFPFDLNAHQFDDDVNGLLINLLRIARLLASNQSDGGDQDFRVPAAQPV